MIREVGEVRAVAGSFASIAAERKTSCDVCELKTACGVALLGNLFGRPTATVRALNLADADIGDRVEIAFDERQLLRGSVAVYIMPLLCMMGCALAAQKLLGSTDSTTALAGFAGLIAGFVLLRYRVSAIRPGGGPLPTVHRRLTHVPSRREPERSQYFGRL